MTGQELLDEARERGLIEDRPDGAIRAKPELEQEMPMLYELIREMQTMEFERTVSNLIDMGLVEMSGVSEDGEFTFTVTDRGRQAAEGKL